MISTRRSWAQWVGYVFGCLLFNDARARIYVLLTEQGRAPLIWYPATFDAAVSGGRVLPAWLQQTLPELVAWPALALHAAHFLSLFVFPALLWQADPRRAQRSMVALLVVFAGGLVGYYLVPTMPPWMAAEQGAIQPVRHLVLELYGRLLSSEVVQLVDTNPVAAVPSIHAAVPFVYALIGAPARWVRWGLWTVAIAQSIGIVYLGEHYLFDAFSGLALAVVAAMIARRLVPTLDGSGG